MASTGTAFARPPRQRRLATRQRIAARDPAQPSHRHEVAVYGGDAGALRRVDNLLSYVGPTTTARDEANRRTTMFDILDMSTIRLNDVPLAPEEPEERRSASRSGLRRSRPRQRSSSGAIASAAGASSSPRPRIWRRSSARLLAALGHESKAELDRARLNSPRGVMREFIQGTRNWDDGGRGRAVAVMDLSHIPSGCTRWKGRSTPITSSVSSTGSPMSYGKRSPTIRTGACPTSTSSIPWAISPSRGSPSRPSKTGASPVERWKLSSATVAASPALLEAMQDLPAIPGLEEPEALSPYFRLCERVRAASPALLTDRGFLETWQWLGLATALAASYTAFLAVGSALKFVGRRDRWGGLAKLAMPAGLVISAAILSWSITRLGLTQVGLPGVGTLIGVLLIVAIALFAYRIVNLVGGWFLARAQKTTTHVDEIAASLGTELMKLLVVVGAIIAVADVVGLPYEGVLAGLGVGGVAIAFAARDTVSNMLGGGILMADRPFQRGDLIELDGTLATVEQVGLRCTRLRSLDDTLLNVPNSHLSDRMIANWGKRRRRKVVLGVGLTYDTPRDKLDTFVKRLKEVLLEHPRIDRDDLYVGLKSFGASSIDVELMFYPKVYAYGSQVEAQHAIVLDIIALAGEVGVEFAFPTRTVHVQPAEAQIPKADEAGTTPAAAPRRASGLG